MNNLSSENAYNIAIAGNPNSGKSTIFNRLTGSHQHVGNWPGKTVKCEQGYYTFNATTFNVVDLPGLYSLAAYSGEEEIARTYLLGANPDLVLVVLDATNLERHLYLAIQIVELGLPVVLALNMSDLVDKQGRLIDCETLSMHLGGVPTIRVAANKGHGIEALKNAIWKRATASKSNGHRYITPLELEYPADIERELSKLEPYLESVKGYYDRLHPRWLALELLTNGKQLIQGMRSDKPSKTVLEEISASKIRLKKSLQEGVEFHIADVRYAEVSRLTQIILDTDNARPETMPERIDRIVTHPVLGIPIFLAVMYLVFRLVVNVSAPYMDWIDAVVSGPLTSWSVAVLTSLGAPDWLWALIVEGVIAGVGGVLVFLPSLIMLFIFIAILEDSGYLSRAAFVTDRFLSFLGLSGRSFVPLILGFGCAVPAIYATRTLENRRDRILTALMIPFMSCSARLPVYVLFCIALFGKRADQVIWGLYALGVAIAIGTGWVFSRTVLKSDEGREFVMELPRYQLPTPSSIWEHVSRRTRDFIEGAGTVILLASIVIWVLLHIPLGVTSLKESAFGRASTAIAPLFEPAGFGTWEASASLMSGLVAKEVVVSSMAEIYLGSTHETANPDQQVIEQLDGIATGFVSATIDAGREMFETLTPGINIFPDRSEAQARDIALSTVLMRTFSPAAALAFLVYVLLYTPCVATLGVIRSEFGGRWALFSALYQTGIAWVGATAVFQIGTLLR
jgi:ferrous iron transport protein B